MSISRDRVYHLIDWERERQKEKWGEPRHPYYRWLAILVEELGEVASSLSEYREEDFPHEVLHLAAVAVAILEEHGTYLHMLFGEEKDERADPGSG